MDKITPCLWFDQNAEEAVKHYCTVFPNSRIVSINHYGDHGPLPKGTVLTVIFELNGMPFMALNGGPQFKFTEAVSFTVKCSTQREIDEIWEKLTHEGQPGPCGWLKDKYGLSWQVVPAVLGEFLQDRDPVRSSRVMQAVMKMGKLDIAGLKREYEQD